MAVAKKNQSSKALSTSEKKPPLLERVIFTTTKATRPVDKSGLPIKYDSEEAYIELQVTASRLPAAIKVGLRLVVKLDVMAKAVNKDRNKPFYEGSVCALGYFICDETIGLENLKEAIVKNDPYIAGLASIVYPLAIMELERTLEATGIPAPRLPMGFDRSIEIAS